MLNYLAHVTRPETMMPVHQCARFCEDPQLFHVKAVKRVAKCLIGMKHVGIEATINFSKGFVAFADSDFENVWNELETDNTDSLFSRTGHIICMFGFPITWCRRLQFRIALSSIEAE